MSSPNNSPHRLNLIQNYLALDSGGNIVYKVSDYNNGHPFSKGDRLALYSAGKGYHKIYIKGENMLASRVVWVLANGGWPENQIDHIDNNKLNNHPSNLRDVTNGQNQMSKKRQMTGVSQYIGVTARPYGKSPWRMQLQHTSATGMRVNIDRTFVTEESAARAYDKYALIYHKEHVPDLNFPEEHIEALFKLRAGL